MSLRRVASNFIELLELTNDRESRSSSAGLSGISRARSRRVGRGEGEGGSVGEGVSTVAGKGKRYEGVEISLETPQNRAKGKNEPFRRVLGSTEGKSGGGAVLSAHERSHVAG